MGVAIPAEIFWAYDIRGAVNEALSPQGVRATGQALWARSMPITGVCAWDATGACPARTWPGPWARA
jgi:hypothetical protein